MNDIELQSTIDESQHGLRLDQALARLFPQYSREQLKQWIIEKAVLVNDKPASKPRDKVVLGDKIAINAHLKAEQNWEAQASPVEIVYQDPAIIVINKPAGLIVHPGAGALNNTLINALLFHFPELEVVPRRGIIHRIDKDTTGLLVIARTIESHTILTKAMQQREIKRVYEAIVHGVVTAGGTIDVDLGRHPTQRTKMSVVRNGRQAITHYRVLKRFRLHSHVQVELETGRTHQIRVHFEHIHHPLVGDATYCKKSGVSSKLIPELQDTLKKFKRQALHARLLALVHPTTGEEMEWEVPPPADFTELLALLTQDSEKK